VTRTGGSGGTRTVDGSLDAGASGAIGTRLSSQLVDGGHEVIGTCRSPDKTERLHGLGAERMVLDLLDPDAVRKAVVDAKPEAIVHQATALADLSDFKHFDRSFAQTNRLRTKARTHSSPPHGRPASAAKQGPDQPFLLLAGGQHSLVARSKRLEEHERARGRGHHVHHYEGGPPFWGHRRWGNVFFGPPPWAGRRARRGDVRTAVLAVLGDKPLHSYDVIRELEERSGGMWSPSPGSVYPTLQMLEDEGLVTSEEQDGKKIYPLTEAGRKELEERRKRAGGAAPWDLGGVPEDFVKLRDAGFQLGAAAMQVARAGDKTHVEKATEILTEARRKIYEILAQA
jgi:DNA-binding PadR family transcriptional regulator